MFYVNILFLVKRFICRKNIFLIVFWYDFRRSSKGEIFKYKVLKYLEGNFLEVVYGIFVVGGMEEVLYDKSMFFSFLEVGIYC